VQAVMVIRPTSVSRAHGNLEPASARSIRSPYPCSTLCIPLFTTLVGFGLWLVVYRPVPGHSWLALSPIILQGALSRMLVGFSTAYQGGLCSVLVVWFVSVTVPAESYRFPDFRSSRWVVNMATGLGDTWSGVAGCTAVSRCQQTENPSRRSPCHVPAVLFFASLKGRSPGVRRFGHFETVRSQPGYRLPDDFLPVRR